MPQSREFTISLAFSDSKKTPFLGDKDEVIESFRDYYLNYTLYKVDTNIYLFRNEKDEFIQCSANNPKRSSKQNDRWFWVNDDIYHDTQDAINAINASLPNYLQIDDLDSVPHIEIYASFFYGDFSENEEPFILDDDEVKQALSYPYEREFAIYKDYLENFVRANLYNLVQIQAQKRGIPQAEVEYKGEVKYEAQSDDIEYEDEAESIDENPHNDKSASKPKNATKPIKAYRYKIYVSNDKDSKANAFYCASQIKKSKKGKGGEYVLYSQDDLERRKRELSAFDVLDISDFKQDEERTDVLSASLTVRASTKGRDKKEALSLGKVLISTNIIRDKVQINRWVKNCNNHSKDLPLNDIFFNPETYDFPKEMATSTSQATDSAQKSNEVFASPPPHNINSINYFNKSLTPDQKETIQKALSNPTPIYLIQGPPGTGKTTVIAELIAQYTAQGKKIWLTSQSNLAVDNVLERLPKDERIFPTRIGSEDKIQDKLFANDSQVIDYFVRQYRGKIREFIDTYGKDIDKYISTYNEFMQIDKELHRLDSSIANAKQEANALIQSSFFAYIDSISKDCANLSILRSISKSMLKEQCERFHKFLCKQSQQNSKYSFLGKYASSDNPNEPNQQWQELWGKGEEARNKEIHTLMQSCIGDTPPNIIKQFMRENHINANTASTKEQAQRLQDKIQEKISEQAQKRDTLAKRKDSIQSALENIAQSLGCGKNLLTQSTANDFKANIKNLQEKLDMYRKLDSLQMPSNSNQLESTIQTIAQKLGLDIQTLGQMQKGFATNATTSNKKGLKKTLRDIAKENSKNISEQELEAIANELLQSKQSAKSSENSTRYANVIEGIKECVNIYAATCNIDPKKLNTTQDEKVIFDVVIVDEVSKMNAIEMLLPMQRAKKLILVGDQHQLPPIFKEGIQKEEITEMLEISDEVFDRYKNLIEHSKFTQFFEIFPDSAKSRLTTQFRMHPHIMEFINHFYNEKRLVCGLPNPDKSRAHEFGELYGIGDRHILWIDSSTSREDAPEHSTSKRNMQEVEVIRKIIKDMASVYKAHKTKHNLDQSKRKEIGVISFYGAQVGELRNIRKDKDYAKDLDIDISTVDDFQGKEKDVIIVSLVRTDKGISHNRFIKDYRRVNVAFSRARQLLIVIACNEAFDRVQLSFGDKEAKLCYQTMRQSQKCFVVNKKLKDIIHYKSSDYTSTDKPHKG